MRGIELVSVCFRLITSGEAAGGSGGRGGRSGGGGSGGGRASHWYVPVLRAAEVMRNPTHEGSMTHDCLRRMHECPADYELWRSGHTDAPDWTGLVELVMRGLPPMGSEVLPRGYTDSSEQERLLRFPSVPWPLDAWAGARMQQSLASPWNPVVNSLISLSLPLTLCGPV